MQRPDRKGIVHARSRGAAFAAVALLVACNRPAAEPAPAAAAPVATPESALPPPAAPKVHTGPATLPEDPEKGQASTAQWQHHLEHEEEERQIAFDHARLKEHRAVVKLITAARARLDRAKTEAALDKAQADMPALITEIRDRIKDLDHWGNNSRLHPEYEALQFLLAGNYAAAKRAALQGDESALTQVRATYDLRMKGIADWLEKAEHEGEEGEAEHELEEREREGARKP